METGKHRLSVSTEQFYELYDLYTSRPQEQLDKEFYLYLHTFKFKLDSGMKKPEFKVKHVAEKKKQDQLVSLGFTDPKVIAAKEIQSARMTRVQAYEQWTRNPLLLNSEQLALANDWRFEQGLMTPEEEDEYNLALMSGIVSGAKEGREKMKQEGKYNGDDTEIPDVI